MNSYIINYVKLLLGLIITISLAVSFFSNHRILIGEVLFEDISHC